MERTRRSNNESICIQDSSAGDLDKSVHALGVLRRYNVVDIPGPRSLDDERLWYPISKTDIIESEVQMAHRNTV